MIIKKKIREIIEAKKGYKNNENNICIICLQDFNSNNNLQELACNHLFHESCLSIWNRISEACPICRKKIKAKKYFLIELKKRIKELLPTIIIIILIMILLSFLPWKIIYLYWTKFSSFLQKTNLKYYDSNNKSYNDINKTLEKFLNELYSTLDDDSFNIFKWIAIYGNIICILINLIYHIFALSLLSIILMIQRIFQAILYCMDAIAYFIKIIFIFINRII